MDEGYGASTHNSTLRGRGRAIKLTWVSLSIGKRSATAPAIAGARTLPSAARFATLLQERRLAVHALLERLGRFLRGLNQYSGRIAPAVLCPVCSLESKGPTSGVYRKTDLRQNVSFSQICGT